MTGLADGTRLVVRGGTPSAEEVVAIALAIDAVERARRSGVSKPSPRMSTWVAACRREGVGRMAAATPSDIRGWG